MIQGRAPGRPLSNFGSRPLARRGREEHGARGAVAEIPPLPKIFHDVPQNGRAGHTHHLSSLKDALPCRQCKFLDERSKPTLPKFLNSGLVFKFCRPAASLRNHGRLPWEDPTAMLTAVAVAMSIVTV